MVYNIVYTCHMFRICFFVHSDLPFDFAQGGEFVEPFRISIFVFRIFSYQATPIDNSIKILFHFDEIMFNSRPTLINFSRANSRSSLVWAAEI